MSGHRLVLPFLGAILIATSPFAAQGPGPTIADIVVDGTVTLDPERVRALSALSLGSTLTPRTLTWWSMRPRYSNSPSARRRARSPERYSRAPGAAPQGSGTNLAAVSSGRAR